MLFEFWTTPGYTHIKAILEDGDSNIGIREEGAGTEIHLKQTVVNFDYEVKDIHPDVLGLLCMVIFFPFVGREVEFPMPVSPRLVRAFENECFTQKKTIKFRNVSDKVPLYSGKKVALSFGGGIDSSSVRQMYPEAYVIHEAHVKDGTLIQSHSHKVVRSLGIERGRVIATNARYLSHPGGWHSWPCSTCTSLLLATDMGIGLILTGSILGSCFIQNGAGFWDRLAARAWHGPSGNYWQSAFETIGLPMFSPVTGVSEMQTMLQSDELLKSDEVVYCFEDDGKACSKCTKCFRREVIRSFVFPQYDPDWSNYDSPLIRAFLSKRPLYFGHIFSTVASLAPDCLPNWAVPLIREGVPLINRDWVMRSYGASFNLCPEPWASWLRERLGQFMSEMTELDVIEMKSWTQT